MVSVNSIGEVTTHLIYGTRCIDWLMRVHQTMMLVTL